MKTLVFDIVCSLLLLIFFTAPAHAVPENSAWLGKHGDPYLKLDDVVEFSASSTPILSVRVGRINTGIVYYDYPKLQLPKMANISISTVTTVRNVLDMLTRADPTYTWVSDGEVVNLMPMVKNPRLIDPMMVLDQIVPKFEAQDQDVVGALHELLKQGRQQGLTGLPNPDLAPPFKKTAGEEYPGLFSLKLKDKSVRQCLNAIVAEDPPAYWLAIPYKDYVWIGAAPSHTHTVKRIPREQRKTTTGTHETPEIIRPRQE